MLLCVYTQRGEVRGIISLYEPEGNGMPIARRTWADIDSLKGETAGDESCKDAAEALIPEIRYQMFLICSQWRMDGPITTADLGSGAKVARVR